MKTFYSFLLFAFILFFQTDVLARSGCCSHHGGVAYCDEQTGSEVCADGTYSPTCRCSKN